MRVISNTNIYYLYLYKNKINDFSQLLRIIYRTKLIKKEEEKNLKGSPYLYNLDLSNNDCYNKNIDKIKLLKEAIEKTTLYCLDISHILYGKEPDNFRKDYDNVRYGEEIKSLTTELENHQKSYINNISNLNNNIVDKERTKHFEDEKLFKILDVNEIINDDKSKYPGFLKINAKELINNNYELKKQINNSEDEYKKMEANLISYLTMKKAEKNIKELKIKIDENKMIII